MKNVSAGLERLIIVRGKKIRPSRRRRFFNASNTIYPVCCIASRDSGLRKFYFSDYDVLHNIKLCISHTRALRLYATSRTLIRERAWVRKLLFIWKCVWYVTSSPQSRVGGGKGVILLRATTRPPYGLVTVVSRSLSLCLYPALEIGRWKIFVVQHLFQKFKNVDRGVLRKICPNICCILEIDRYK